MPRAAARPRARGWWLILAARVALFAVAAAGSAYAVLGAGRAPDAAARRFRCPMHPDAVSSGPAACPICGMALVPRDPPRLGAGHEEPPARVARAVRRRFAEAIRAPAWVDAGGAVVAALYRDDLVGMAPEQPAQFFAASAAATGVDTTLSAGPPIEWDGATVRARFQPAGPVSPGDEGVIAIPAVARELVTVPPSAIVAAPDGPYVFVVDPATRREVRRVVRTGRDHQGAIAVLDGIAEGDEVVIGDAFFVAAERALRPEAP